ncbi:Zn(II)2Cys6 transcription factor [Penicillium maclennaniae]|uniref:Zn(II)2Cys6 transcription factor n=1 Tax=Penicillium maclennaniae TaxID=1343394 RepID=UPI00254035A8|nr:Zn(II)2Cys6 transcription factor [Penicillium maclennaniae]KAJ5670670.1 Zn(II)2Cys6 transcription factor [Penicillium maclennaniae]
MRTSRYIEFARWTCWLPRPSCTRCRRQKIKCTGSQPCDGSTKRKLTCVFDGRDPKTLVITCWECRILASLWARGFCNMFDEPVIVGATGIYVSREWADLCVKTPFRRIHRTNQNSSLPGNTIELVIYSQGLSLIHEHLYQEALPTGALLFDGATDDLGWDGLQAAHNADTPPVPKFDHAIYLINTVKFRCEKLYHLFDEIEFMRNLYEFHSVSKLNVTGSLWYIHFLLIIAFRKAFQCNKPAGAELFVNTLHLLPEVSVLHQEPIESTEILCCAALYLQAL